MLLRSCDVLDGLGIGTDGLGDALCHVMVGNGLEVFDLQLDDKMSCLLIEVGEVRIHDCELESVCAFALTRTRGTGNKRNKKEGWRPDKAVSAQVVWQKARKRPFAAECALVWKKALNVTHAKRPFDAYQGQGLPGSKNGFNLKFDECLQTLISLSPEAFKSCPF